MFKEAVRWCVPPHFSAPPLQEGCKHFLGNLMRPAPISLHQAYEKDAGEKDVCDARISAAVCGLIRRMREEVEVFGGGQEGRHRASGFRLPQ